MHEGVDPTDREERSTGEAQTNGAGHPPRSMPPLRITPRYYTGEPAYLWMNRLQCVGVGEVDMRQMRVTYDIYALR